MRSAASPLPQRAAAAAPRLPGTPDLRSVRDQRGESCAELVARMRPDYRRAWLAIGGAYLWMASGVLAVALLAAWGGGGRALLLAPLAAVWVGLGLQALICFMHEAAHFNLHADKRANDWLADWLICPWVGEAIRHYRTLHWQHHLHLGGAGDTEVSYRQRLGWRFVLESLTGVQMVRVLLHRQSASERGAGGPAAGAATRLRGVALHLLVLAVLGWSGGAAVALTWGLAAGSVYPFCNALRQLLEHRPSADGAPLDAVNRLFGTDPLSRGFGAAGFNRHLLHHWCPSVSYTRFDDLEAYFSDTALAPELQAARTTYRAAARRLWTPA
ncbi:MAG: fatty acid desaturase [Deltaproteobacteria bacterium]|nr:fatty acid desaturase [Deltaproteobacteria bacterium]